MTIEFLRYFDIWNIKKKKITQKSKLLQFKERDIFFINLGQNINKDDFYDLVKKTILVVTPQINEESPEGIYDEIILKNGSKVK